MLRLLTFLGLLVTSNAIGELRLVAPRTLAAGTPALVRVERRDRGSEWKLAEPDAIAVVHTLGVRVLEDPAAVAMNPLTVQSVEGFDRASMQVVVRGDQAKLALPVGKATPTEQVTLSIEADAPGHRFDGFGGGVLFYDNQWELSRGDEIWRWCFEDVQATFLHLLIRPRCEPANDNDDWRVLDESRLDFSKSERAIRVAKQALAVNPDLKIYLSLYSPPAWMKTNESTRGDGGLKPGLAYRQELAEYFYLYLRRLKSEGIEVDYLAFFNEPDWTHGQDGMKVDDLGKLADLFAKVAESLETLIDADDSLTMPKLIFPDSLGAGGITRSKRDTPKLLARQAMLRERVDVWGVHDYWDTAGYWPVRFQELRDFPPVGDKPIWMTEWAQRFRYGDLESANEYGASILNALRLGAQAWMVFEWCHPSGNQSGLISCDWYAKPPRERYWRSKAYYLFQQLANTTPAGSTIVPSNLEFGEGVIEHLAVREGTRLIVHVHNRGPNPIDLRVAWPLKAPPKALATGPVGNSRPHKTITESSNLIETLLPANTLVTLIGE